MKNRTPPLNRSLPLASALILAATLVAACGTKQTRAVVQTSADIPAGSATQLIVGTSGRPDLDRPWTRRQRAPRDHAKGPDRVTQGRGRPAAPSSSRESPFGQ